MNTIRISLPLIVVICLMTIARFTNAQPDSGDARLRLPLPLYGTKYSLLFRKSTDSDPIEFRYLDWIPGNTLMRGAIPISTDHNIPSSFVLYSHAKLGGFLDASGWPLYTQGLNTEYEITLVFGMSVKAYRFATSDRVETIVFQEDANGPVNYFEIYYDVNRNSDNLSGTGFNDGILLMRGNFKQDEGLSGVHNHWLPDLDNLDNFSNNDFPGIGTLVGFGGFQGVVTIDASSINSDFFPQANRIVAMDLRIDGSTITPFDQENPSRNFWDGANSFEPQYGVGVGAYDSINGFSSGSSPVDLQLQSDMHSSQRARVILIRDYRDYIRPRKYYRRDIYFP